jgi:hypothetical protein
LISASIKQVHGASNDVNAAQLGGGTWEATRIDVGRLTHCTWAKGPGIDVG